MKHVTPTLFLPVFLLYLFSMIAPFSLAAQVEDEEGDGIDVGFVEPQDNGLDYSFPAVPRIERQAVVLYEHQAQAYVRITRSSPVTSLTPVTIYYGVDGETTTPLPLVVENEDQVLTNLPLNKTISIYAYNEAAALVKIGVLNTSRIAEDVIDLPMHLYLPITDWISNPTPSSNLYTFAAGLSDAHYLEKAYFIQQFFYGGHPLPDTQIGQIPETPIVRTSSQCLCRTLQLAVDETAEPRGGKVQIDSKNGNYLPEFKTGQSTTKTYANGKGKRWHAYSFEGAAKYQQVWIEAKSCVGGNQKMQMNNLPEQEEKDDKAIGPVGGNRAFLSYTFTCVGIDDFRPEDCPCERKRAARVCWHYSAQADVEVDLKNGWCWNGRGIWGGAEDVVTLMAGYSDLNASTMPMPLLAQHVKAGAGCDMNFDEAKLAVNLAKTALYGFKTIKGLKVEDPSFDENAWNTAYGFAAANAIKNLFTDEYVKTNGSCGGEINPGGQLLDGCDFFFLETNRRLVVALVSNSNLIVEGHGKYLGTARILSTHALSGTISISDPAQTGENCCSNGHGVYSLSSFYPGMNTASAQAWVRSNFIGAGMNTIPGFDLNITGEFGYRGGGERPDCKLVIVDGSERNNPDTRPRSETAAHLTAIGNLIWIQQLPEAQNWQFSIIDAAGRIVHEQQGAGTDRAVYDFGNSPVPAGIYFIRLRTAAGGESRRFVKAQ